MMKSKILLFIAAIVFIFALQPSSLCAQGALTPPGAPAPIMKSLDQVEARTAITNTASLVTISQPGSYYLTHNLTVSTGDGIDINTNDVTLDLNGFTISSTRSSASIDSGILLGTGASDVTLRNGHIKSGVTNNAGVFSGGGFAYGININSQNSNVHVADVSVSGCLYYGIYLGNNNSTVVESCTVRTVGNYGIFAQTVLRSAAYQCGGTAIGAGTATDCYGESVGTSDAVNAVNVSQCFGYNTSSGAGLHGGTAIGCYGYSNSGYGLIAFIGNSCEGVTTSGTNEVVSFKYNMP